MPSMLQITVTDRKGDIPVTILHLDGDLDSKTYQTFEAKAHEAIVAGASNLLIDLSNLGFMSSAGLRALHGISNKVKASSSNGQMKLLKPSETVSLVFRTLGFDRHFDIQNDLEAAIKSF